MKTNSRLVAVADVPALFGRSGPTTDAAQLDLPLWPRGTLAEALLAFKSMKLRMGDIEASTLRDYDEFDRWLTHNLGTSCALSAINFDRLERLYHLSRGKLRGVTILKRYKHLIAAMRYAAERRVIGRDDVPAIPPIPNDSRPGERVLDLMEFRQLRLALEGRYRDFGDVVYWTGLHSKDVWSLKSSHFEPDFEWKDETGAVIWKGRYLRTNSKNRKVASCAPVWLPMEPELREASREMIAKVSTQDGLLIGRISRVLHKWFDVACERCGIQRVQPDRDLRRSFASMLAARGYSSQYIQFAQGHAGKPIYESGRFVGTARPTVDDRHYVRVTTDFLICELKQRLARIGLQK